jgi:hypothetical protein
MTKPIQDHYVGQFVFGKRRPPGRLVLNGPETSLEIYAPVGLDQSRTVRGVAQSGQRITLCAVAESGGESGPTADGKRYQINRYFPHYVAIGKRFINPHLKDIRAISFTTDRIGSIFADDEAFGFAEIKDINSVLPERAKKPNRPIKLSKLFYFTDRGPLVSVQTETTKFEAWNTVSYKWPSVVGIHLDNVIRLRLEFRKPVKLEDAISAGFDFRSFCELLTVGPHCLSDIKIEHKAAKENEDPISLVMSYGDKPTANVTDLRRHSLIAAGSNPNEFERVLTNWISSQSERRIARLRLIQGLREERTFSIDRLVAAANAFDLLPFESKPLPAQVQSNVDDLKKSVRTSLLSPYRESILDALGRLKGSNLRSKILARFEILPESLRSKLAEMETIIGYCVQARHYFVHGTRPTKLSPKVIEEYLVFFTQTLEFIFIVAELSECGWTSKSADSQWFWTYLENYSYSSKQLKDDLT